VTTLTILPRFFPLSSEAEVAQKGGKKIKKRLTRWKPTSSPSTTFSSSPKMSNPKRLKLDPALSQLFEVTDRVGAVLTGVEENDGSTSLGADVLGVVLELKEGNRVAQVSMRRHKAATHDAKQRMDRLNLHLQNLHYEQMNLDRQLQGLQSQKPAVPWSDLISLRPDEAATITHHDIMQRLTAQLQARRSLEADEARLRESLVPLQEGNETRSKRLSSATQELDIVVERAERVRDTLFTDRQGSDIPPPDCTDAHSLPRPLFTLFSKTVSYITAFVTDGSVAVSIKPARKVRNICISFFFSFLIILIR